MLLCRRVKPVGCKYRCNFAGTAEVGIIPQRHVTRAPREEPCRTAYARARDERLSRSYNVSRARESLQDGFIKRVGCEWRRSPARTVSVFPSESVSAAAAAAFTAFPFPPVSRRSRKAGDGARLCAPGYALCRSFSENVPSRAASARRKEASWTEDEPAFEVKKVQPPEIPQERGEEPEPEKKQRKTAQLKKVFKEYGAVGVSFHIGISLISLGIFYLALSSGIDMAAVLCKMGFSESIVQSKLAAGTSTFVLAYAVHKLFAPLRISITLVSVPLIVRYLRRTGLFKPPPSSM